MEDWTCGGEGGLGFRVQGLGFSGLGATSKGTFGNQGLHGSGSQFCGVSAHAKANSD